MKEKASILLIIFIVLYGNCTLAQQAVEGYFTSESRTVYASDRVMVSIKKYNPTAGEIKNAMAPPKNSPMNYLQVPFTVTNASLFNNGFESSLYCLDKNGDLKW